MSADPLAPTRRIVSIVDEAIDPAAFTVERMTKYLADYDEKHLAFRDGAEPTWFRVTALKQSTLADHIDPVEAESRKVKLAFLYCCHRVESASGATLFEVDEKELTTGKPPRATDAWWDRVGDVFGVEMMYSVGVAVMRLCRVPKGKRGPLP